VNVSICVLRFLGAFSIVLKQCVESLNYIESVFLIVLLVGQRVEYILKIFYSYAISTTQMLWHIAVNSVHHQALQQ
jgi:hypothetical protein